MYKKSNSSNGYMCIRANKKIELLYTVRSPYYTTEGNSCHIGRIVQQKGAWAGVSGRGIGVAEQPGGAEGEDKKAALPMD